MLSTELWGIKAPQAHQSYIYNKTKLTKNGWYQEIKFKWQVTLSKYCHYILLYYMTTCLCWGLCLCFYISAWMFFGCIMVSSQSEVCWNKWSPVSQTWQIHGLFMRLIKWLGWKGFPASHFWLIIIKDVLIFHRKLKICHGIGAKNIQIDYHDRILIINVSSCRESFQAFSTCLV